MQIYLISSKDKTLSFGMDGEVDVEFWASCMHLNERHQLLLYGGATTTAGGKQTAALVTDEVLMHFVDELTALAPETHEILLESMNE